MVSRFWMVQRVHDDQLFANPISRGSPLQIGLGLPHELKGCALSDRPDVIFS
jgi:hypothetical protein